MTPEEAIEELKFIKRGIASYECNTPQCKTKWRPEETYNALNMAGEALEKQIPKKVVREKYAKSINYSYVSCPVCKRVVATAKRDISREIWTFKPPHCDRCGQALDWSEVEE